MNTFQYGSHPRMWMVGNWCLYIDRSNQFIGRAPNPSSVVWAFLCLTAEHFRPDAASAEHERRQHDKAIAKWQRVRDQIWQQSLRAVRLDPDADYPDLLRRRKKYLRSRYELVAGDARARGEWVPSLADLQRQVHVEVELIT